MKRAIQRTISGLLVMLLCAGVPAAGGLTETMANGENAMLSTFEQAEKRPQIVRVFLSRLGIADRVDIVLDGLYSLGNQGENSMIFKRGSELSILLKNGSLIVYYKDMSFNAGASLYLTRYQAEDGKENGIRFAGEPAIYEGDLFLRVDEESIRPILSIHVEDYLQGVVPYEMSDDFPLEALKAQAVTARTYALRKQNADREYDLVDTTNDQVFKGHLKGYERAAQAIEETQGLCGFYKGKLAECFYAASNGGQTTLVEHVWSKGDYGYYEVTDDPYDLENPQSLVKAVSLPRKPSKVEAISLGLRSVLVKALAKELTAKGYDPAPESLRVDEVLSLSVDTPTFSGSKVMSMLNIQFSYSGRTRQDPVVLINQEDEEVSLFIVDATYIPFAAEQQAATPEPTPSPTPKPTYGEFEAAKEPVTLHIPLFPDAAKALALSMNGNMNNEVITVIEGKNDYTLEARRYGHGVGMSQRGAEWMAQQHKKNYQEILKFYYPGMQLMRYPEADIALPVLDTEHLAVPGPRPTPTPRPTLMPVTGEAKGDEWYAVVWEITDESTLNLRAMPDMSGEILMRLYKNQRLLVVERCPEEGWVKVKTDAVEGYVMESFLKAE